MAARAQGGYRFNERGFLQRSEGGERNTDAIPVRINDEWLWPTPDHLKVVASSNDRTLKVKMNGGRFLLVSGVATGRSRIRLRIKGEVVEVPLEKGQTPSETYFKIQHAVHAQLRPEHPGTRVHSCGSWAERVPEEGKEWWDWKEVGPVLVEITQRQPRDCDAFERR